mgnify:CR=1 FL=1
MCLFKLTFGFGFLAFAIWQWLSSWENICVSVTQTYKLLFFVNEILKSFISLDFKIIDLGSGLPIGKREIKKRLLGLIEEDIERVEYYKPA